MHVREIGPQRATPAIGTLNSNARVASTNFQAVSWAAQFNLRTPAAVLQFWRLSSTATSAGTVWDLMCFMGKSDAFANASFDRFL
eukprot:4105192-Alexandrium_andersonii.AAC.1